MKKYILTLTLAFLPFLAVEAQLNDVRIGIQTGYNSYQLNDLKELESFIATSSIPGQLLFPVQEFPNYMNFGLGISADLKEYVIGLQYNFHSTGSRYHYSDYSGEVGLNSVLRGNFLGIFGKVSIISSRDKSFRFYGGIAPNYIWGNYTVKQFLNVSGINSEASTDFETKGIGTELFFSIEQTLGVLNISFKLGYDKTISSKLLLDGKPVADAANRTSEASVNWNGLRTSLGLIIKLGKASSQKSP